MRRLVMAVFLALLAWCGSAWAQTYPTRAVRFVVGFGVGGPDTTARLLAAQLNATTGKSFFVEDHPGASGIVGTDIVAKAPPDGYSLLVTSDSYALLPATHKTLPFDVFKDLIPVSLIVRSQSSFLVVAANSPIHSLKELIAAARDPNNKLSYGSTGIGTGSHLRMALFNNEIGGHLTHVPYKSPGEALAALMGGEVQTMFVTSTQGLPQIQSGKVRALAYDDPKRADFAPDVPTMAEAGGQVTGLPSSWHAMLAPAKTPPAVITWLEGAVHKAVETKEFQDGVIKLGLIPVGSTSAEFKTSLAEDVDSLGKAVKAAGVPPE